MKMWKSFEDVVGNILRGIAAAFLGIVFLLFLLNVATRLPFFTYNPKWIDETIQFFLVWTIFLSAAELVRVRAHFIVDFLTDKLHGTFLGRMCRLISMCLMLVTYSVIFFFGVRLCLQSNATMFTLVFMKKSYFYACIPVSAVFMIIFTVRDLTLSIMDLATKGKITEKMDAEKQAELLDEDEDAKAIAEAAAVLREEEPEE